MEAIKKIIKISKDLASSIINKEFINSSDLHQTFSQNDASDIIKELTDPEIKKEREKQIKAINKSKQNDWINIMPKIQINKKPNLFNTFYKFAAILIICLSLTYVYFEEINNIFLPSKDNVAIPFNDKNVVLELDNGAKEIISTNGIKSILNKDGKVVGIKEGATLNYSNPKKEKTSEKLVFNQLTIPYGKVFQIVLSDGTKVYLNAGSTLQYPVHFVKGKKRMVFLKGEAYFDVSEDKKHPFIVKTKGMDIRVLGTKFNVSSYSEDHNISTVLVEGAVNIYSNKTNYNKAQKIKLSPGHRAVWKKLDGKVKIRKVDTSIYTAWIDGKIVFEHMPFKNIIKKLERRYDVSITNNNMELANEKFTASFDIENIEQVLNSFIKNYNFIYAINANRIEIN